MMRASAYKQNLENLRRNHYAPRRRVSPCVTSKTHVMCPKEPSDASPPKPLARSCAHDLRHHAPADPGSACLAPCPGRPCGGRGAPCLRRLRHLPRGAFCPASLGAALGAGGAPGRAGPSALRSTPHSHGRAGTPPPASRRPSPPGAWLPLLPMALSRARSRLSPADRGPPRP
jgi:hypothetical protein